MPGIYILFHRKGGSFPLFLVNIPAYIWIMFFYVNFKRRVYWRRTGIREWEFITRNNNNTSKTIICGVAASLKSEANAFSGQ